MTGEARRGMKLQWSVLRSLYLRIDELHRFVYGLRHPSEERAVPHEAGMPSCVVAGERFNYRLGNVEGNADRLHRIPHQSDKLKRNSHLKDGWWVIEARIEILSIVLIHPPLNTCRPAGR